MPSPNRSAACTIEEPARNTATSRAFLTLLAFGTGFYLAWQTVNISPTLYPQPLPGVAQTMRLAYHFETVFFIALLALYAVWQQRSGKPLLCRRWFVALTATLMCMGTALVSLCGYALPAAVTLGVFAGQTLLGCKAGMLLLWGELLCSVRLRHALPCVAGAYAVSFALCLLVANLDDPAALTLRTVLPALSAFTLLTLRHDLLDMESSSPAGNPLATPAAHPIASASPLPWRLFLGIGIFGAIISCSNYLSETKTAVSTELYTLIAGVAVSLLVLVIALRIPEGRFNFVSLYRLITPLIIGCLMLTLVLEPSDQWYEALAIGGAWTFFRIFSWTLWCYIAMQSKLGAACSFAVGQITLAVLSTLAELLFSSGILTGASLTVAVSAIVVGAVVTSALVMNEGELVQVIGHRANPGTLEATEPIPPPADPRSDAALANACAQRAAARFDLSDREREIAALVLLGHDNANITGQLTVTESTLRTHLRNIYAKADVHSRQELVDALAEFAEEAEA